MTNIDSKAREYALACRMEDPDEYSFMTILTNKDLDLIPPGYEGFVTFSIRRSYSKPAHPMFVNAEGVMV